MYFVIVNAYSVFAVLINKRRPPVSSFLLAHCAAQFDWTLGVGPTLVMLYEGASVPILASLVYCAIVAFFSGTVVSWGTPTPAQGTYS